MASCCPTMKFQRPFGLNRKVVSDSGRVSSFWGAEVVKANHLKAQWTSEDSDKAHSLCSHPICWSRVSCMFSHICNCSRENLLRSLFVMLNLILSNLCVWCSTCNSLFSGFSLCFAWKWTQVHGHNEALLVNLYTAASDNFDFLSSFSWNVIWTVLKMTSFAVKNCCE